MLVFTGLSHRHAPLELRERCAVPAEDRDRIRAELRGQFRHAVLLATCGRTELYIDEPDPDAAETNAVAWLARLGRIDPEELQVHAQTARGNDAVWHGVRVACGLESAVEGEDEILGQIRRAWLDAGGAGSLSPALDAAFRLAVRVGRQVRRTGDPNAWTSLADIAAAHVAVAVQKLAAPRVLIAGSGPMGLRTAGALRARVGPHLELALASRNAERVAAHAARLGARPLVLADVPAALAWADAAVVGLRTPRTLIEPADVPPRTADRPLLIVDLSVPRAVADAVSVAPGVCLRNVDNLGVDGGPSRWSAADRAQVERLVEQAIRDYAAVEERSDALATLATLRMQADGIRRALLTRTFRRLPHLDDEARWTIDALSRALVNRVLHEPTLRLRADGDSTVAGQVRLLFGMGDEEWSAEPHMSATEAEPELRAAMRLATVEMANAR